MSKYKLLIFDLDGTILYTLGDLSAAVNYSLRNNNLGEVSTEIVRKSVGNGIKKLVERVVNISLKRDSEQECTDISELVERVYTDFVTYYPKHATDTTVPFKGIEEALRKLKSEGFILTMLSNKKHFVAEKLAEKYFPGIFEIAYGERDNVARKPDPEAVYEIIKKCGVTRDETCYIGDSEVDIKTAANAGIDLVTVSWGFRTYDELVNAKAKVIVSSMDEMCDAILFKKTLKNEC